MSMNQISSQWNLHPLLKRDYFVALAFAIIALLARLPLMLRGHTLLRSDEAIVGIMAQDIAALQRFPIYFYGQRYMGALEAYVVAALYPFFSDEILALRMAPALFFSLLVAACYLTFTRWLGRRGGTVASCTLIAASPMFAQWSISARGAYIEILLVGILLWWGWSELAFGRPARRSQLQFLVGVTLGVGLWLNPMIVLFCFPIVMWHLFNGPIGHIVDELSSRIRLFALVRRPLERTRTFLPASATLLFLICTALFSVQVEGGRAERLAFLGLLPARAVLPFIALSLLAAAAKFKDQIATLVSRANTLTPFVVGILLGYSPSLVYVLSRLLQGQPLEECLPLGFRPIWSLGLSLRYLFSSLPVLLGADPQRFLFLAAFGWDVKLSPLNSFFAAIVKVFNVVSLVSIVLIIVYACWICRKQLDRLMRLNPVAVSPACFFLIALAGLLGAFVSNASVIDATCVRYLLPAWVMVAGLFGAIMAIPTDEVAKQARDTQLSSSELTSFNETLGRTANENWLSATATRPGLWLCILGYWVACLVGQVALTSRIGAPHPLEAVAVKLKNVRHWHIVAEALDAHYLSFFTKQNPRVFEYQSFWPRLGHYYSHQDFRPLAYLFRSSRKDWVSAWYSAGWPPPAPPAAFDTLRPRLEQLPTGMVKEKVVLSEGYELWLLSSPLNE